MRQLLCVAALATLLPNAAYAAATTSSQPDRADLDAILETYGDIAAATYGDALATAESLEATVQSFLQAPDQAGLAAARATWQAARVPYLQSEVFRFGNAIVDDWEGRVNAWPLDEGLIDYVDAGYGTERDENIYYSANVIAHPTLMIGGREIDAARIDKALIRSLHEIDDVEANVATGYHAVEFLLWGQDLNGTGPGAGARPWTDYAPGESCTHGNCDRRRDYLTAAVALLTDDLAEMAADWAPGGAARRALAAEGQRRGLAAILVGMGSLSYGELAGERMKLGLLLHDPEEEQDCFSDNTHNAHYNDALGIENVYLGRYRRTDGSLVTGGSLSDLVKAQAPGLDVEMRANLADTLAAMGAIRQRADAGEMAYDQMIGEGNAEGNALVQAGIDGLVAQTRTIEKIVTALELGNLQFEGSESLDAPQAVFQ